MKWYQRVFGVGSLVAVVMYPFIKNEKNADTARQASPETKTTDDVATSTVGRARGVIGTRKTYTSTELAAKLPRLCSSSARMAVEVVDAKRPRPAT
eukprot:1329327-Prymnesium_polylepis.4